MIGTMAQAQAVLRRVQCEACDVAHAEPVAAACKGENHNRFLFDVDGGQCSACGLEDGYKIERRLEMLFEMQIDHVHVFVAWFSQYSRLLDRAWVVRSNDGREKEAGIE